MPKLNSIAGAQRYPIDFNMKVQIMQDDEKRNIKETKEAEIQQTLVQPLNSLYVRLDDMRVQLKRLKEARDQMQENLKDVDLENIPDEDKEIYEAQMELLT